MLYGVAHFCPIYRLYICLSSVYCQDWVTVGDVQYVIVNQTTDADAAANACQVNYDAQLASFKTQEQYTSVIQNGNL